MACDFEEWVIQQILLASRLEILQGIHNVGQTFKACSVVFWEESVCSVCYYTSYSYLHYDKMNPATEGSILSTDNTGNLEEVGQT